MKAHRDTLTSMSRRAGGGVVAIGAILVLMGQRCDNDPQPDGLQPEPPAATAPKGQDGSPAMNMKLANSIHGNFVHKELKILPLPHDAPPAFDSHARQLFADYAGIAEAMFNGDTAEVRSRAGAMRKRLDGSSGDSLDEEAADAWKGHQTVLQTSLHQLETADSAVKRAEHFSHISEAMYCVIRSFDVIEPPIYVGFCPMALGGHGAYWLTERAELRNPYMGKENPTCGEIVETIP